MAIHRARADRTAGFAALAVVQEAVLELGKKQVLIVAAYGFAIMILYRLGSADAAGVPLSFILKDRLHLSPSRVSMFSFLIDWPFYLGFAFGFVRDRWKPFGRGDRGYFMLLPALVAATYTWLSFVPVTYWRVAVGFALITALSVLLGAAAQGLITAIAQHFAMTGRLSVAIVLSGRLVLSLSSAYGGWLAGHLSPHRQFLVLGALALPMIGMAFVRPRTIFGSGFGREPSPAGESSGAAMRRLVRHTAVFLPAAIVFLWDFAPGWGTPLFFYLTNKVHLSEAAYGTAMASLSFGTIVASIAYGGICARVPLRKLLYAGVVLGVIGAPLFLFIRTEIQAYVVGFLAGASLGIAWGAFYDLLQRSCPKELEGAAFMLTASMTWIAGDISDLFGSWLYERGGFGLALAVATALTASIFVILPFVPKVLTDSVEGHQEQAIEYSAAPA